MYAHTERNPKKWEHWDPALMARGLADYQKASLLPIRVTTSNLVVLHQRVRVNKKEPQNWALGPIGMWRDWPKKHAPSLYVLTHQI